MKTLTILSEIDVILSVAQHVTTVIFFSAGDKSRVKWDNSRNSTQKMRTIQSKVINVGSDTFGNPIFHEGLQN